MTQEVHCMDTNYSSIKSDQKFVFIYCCILLLRIVSGMYQASNKYLTNK